MFFFNLKIFQIRNPIVFSPDNINISCSAGDPLDVARSIIDNDTSRQEDTIRGLKVPSEVWKSASEI